LRYLFTIAVSLLTLTANAQSATTKSTSKSGVAKQTTGKQTATNQAASKQVAPKQLATKQTASKPATSKQSTGKQTAAAKKATPRYYPQMQPTPDRYKEIQGALANKGYFAGEADGTWGPSSAEALKRFQHDQNLNEDGKIDSLSLIALGLGPSRK
jgi:peptidoglycan hydrolase-like protein with peptidoglycan-binding domain